MNPEFDRGDLARAVAAQLNLPEAQVLDVLRATAQTIRAQNASGVRVEWKDLGAFDLVIREGRMYRHPRTGEAVYKSDRMHVKFKAAKKFKAEVSAAKGIPCV